MGIKWFGSQTIYRGYNTLCTSARTRVTKILMILIG